MDKWAHFATGFYYTGVGAVLIGTSIRFIYRFVHGIDQKAAFVDSMKETHLPNIYGALKAIAKKLDIDLDIPRP